MNALRTSYEFTLPRGYVDQHGTVHRNGAMRLATARDELEPLRDPRVDGPDDPRLTVLVLARVVTSLGDLEMVTTNEIEGLFAVDLAYLQDFYGVINFGNQAEFEALVQAQAATQLVGDQPSTPESADVTGDESNGDAPASSTPSGVEEVEARPRMRHAVEELPRRSG